MKPLLVILLLLVLAACGPGLSDPYTQAGQAQGAIQGTAQARVDASLAAHATAQAADVAARQTQYAQAAQGTAAAAQALTDQDRAIGTIMAAEAQGTALAVWVAGQVAQATATGLAADATRAAAAAQTSDRRGSALFAAAYTLILGCILILLWLLLRIADALQRRASARAAVIEAEARRQLVVETSAGLADIADGVRLIAPRILERPAPPVDLRAVDVVVPYTPLAEKRDLLWFIGQCGQLAGWTASKVPTKDELGMSGSEWQGWIDQLKAMGWVRTANNGTFVTIGTLDDMLRRCPVDAD